MCYSPSSRLRACVFCFSRTAAAPGIYTLSLHDALPISGTRLERQHIRALARIKSAAATVNAELGVLERRIAEARSEEHTSELQSHSDLVCRLLLEKKKRERSCTVK